jgi:hypothetical protein
MLLYKEVDDVGVMLIIKQHLITTLLYNIISKYRTGYKYLSSFC